MLAKPQHPDLHAGPTDAPRGAAGDQGHQVCRQLLDSSVRLRCGAPHGVHGVRPRRARRGAWVWGGACIRRGSLFVLVDKRSRLHTLKVLTTALLYGFRRSMSLSARGRPGLGLSRTVTGQEEAPRRGAKPQARSVYTL